MSNVLLFLRQFDDIKMITDGSGINISFSWIQFDENGDHWHNCAQYHTNWDMTQFEHISSDKCLAFEELFNS